MRDVIINIVTELLEYDYFNNFILLNIHVNGDEYRVGDYGHKTFDIKNFEKWLTNDDIENYNITIELESGNAICGDLVYLHSGVRKRLIFLNMVFFITELLVHHVTNLMMGMAYRISLITIITR